MDASIRKILADFDANPMQEARALRLLFESNRYSFLAAALPVLRDESDSAGLHYIATLLHSHDLLLAPLCSPQVFTRSEAIRIGRHLMEVDAQFDLRLLRSGVNNNGSTSPEELERLFGTPPGMRMLEILGEISDGSRVISTMTQLMSHPDPRVRSKAALLVGRSNKNHKWVKDRLGEADPRVRANAIESLWGSDTDGSRAVYWTALGDDDDRVVGNAILALYRLGDPASIQLLLQLVAHPEIPFRVTGVWAMGETGDPRFMPMLARMIAEQVRELRANAFRSMAKIKKAIAARTAGASFNVMVGPLRRARDNWVEFIAAVRSASGVQPPELNFTNFALWEDSKLVREYTIRQRGKQEPVAVAIGMPRILDRFSPEQEIQQNAAEQGLRYKRKQDVWTVLKYVTVDPEHEVSAATSAAMEPADEDLSSLRMRFTKNPDAIAAAIAKPGTRLACAANLSQTARCLIGWVRQVQAARNVIIICQSPADTFGPDVQEQIEAAEAASVAVHVITPWPADAMQELCSHTQGTLLVPANQEEIPDALEALCASLLNSYDVRYKPENDVATKLRLQVYTATMIGEASRKLPWAETSASVDKAVAEARGKAPVE